MRSLGYLLLLVACILAPMDGAVRKGYRAGKKPDSPSRQKHIPVGESNTPVLPEVEEAAKKEAAKPQTLGMCVPVLSAGQATLAGHFHGTTSTGPVPTADLLTLLQRLLT